MNDLISRSWLLDVFEHFVPWDTEKDRNRAIHHVRELAPSAQQWIPCSERLPKIGKEVLLSIPNTIFIAEYHGSGDPVGLWLVEGHHHYLANVNGCAWMSLPEPYKGGQ